MSPVPEPSRAPLSTYHFPHWYCGETSRSRPPPRSPSQGRRPGSRYPQPSLKAAVPRPPPRQPVSRRPKAAASVASIPSRRSRPPSQGRRLGRQYPQPSLKAAAPRPPPRSPVPPAVAQGRRPCPPSLPPPRQPVSRRPGRRYPQPSLKVAAPRQARNSRAEGVRIAATKLPAAGTPAGTKLPGRRSQDRPLLWLSTGQNARPVPVANRRPRLQ